MISFESALSCLKANVFPLSVERIKTFEATGRFLAEDIFSPINLPPFDNSSVDGFAVFHEETGTSLSVQKTVAAGEPAGFSAFPGTTCRVMTGAPIPHGYDAVVMQENVDVKEDRAWFKNLAKKGENIRFAGEDVRKESPVFKRGQEIQAAQLGLLCALGIDEIIVYRKPRVAILSTGNELVMPGTSLYAGQVYYCTGPLLASLVSGWGAEVMSLETVGDCLESTVRFIQKGLNADLLLVTGGMSVGQYDFVRPALEKLWVKEIFFQGRWRPGKPLYFGTFESKPVLGIPGNPVACFVMAHLFVKAALARLCGQEEVGACWQRGCLKTGYDKPVGFSFFARGDVNLEHQVTLFGGQGSHEIGTLSKANSLVWLPEDKAHVSEGEAIKYLSIASK